jgi:hypothetical protein
MSPHVLDPSIQKNREGKEEVRNLLAQEKAFDLVAVYQVALHPVALHPVALHPVALHPVALHPVAFHTPLEYFGEKDSEVAAPEIVAVVSQMEKETTEKAYESYLVSSSGDYTQVNSDAEAAYLLSI